MDGNGDREPLSPVGGRAVCVGIPQRPSGQQEKSHGRWWRRGWPAWRPPTAAGHARDPEPCTVTRGRGRGREGPALPRPQRVLPCARAASWRPAPAGPLDSHEMVLARSSMAVVASLHPRGLLPGVAPTLPFTSLPRPQCRGTGLGGAAELALAGPSRSPTSFSSSKLSSCAPKPLLGPQHQMKSRLLWRHRKPSGGRSSLSLSL